MPTYDSLRSLYIYQSGLQGVLQGVLPLASGWLGLQFCTQHLPKHIHHNGMFCLLGRRSGRSQVWFLWWWFEKLTMKLNVLSAKACKRHDHVCAHLPLPTFLRTETRLQRMFYKNILQRLSSLFFLSHSARVSQKEGMVIVCVYSAVSLKSLKIISTSGALPR